MEELNSTVLPNERGELRLVLPFRNREKQDIEITWTDVRYTLKIDGTKGAFEWAGVALPHRRACQALLDENRSVLAAAQKVEGTLRLAPAEIKGLSKLGVCQPAGLGSWALSLERASGTGEPSARRVELEIEVVRIDLEGKRLSAPFGTFAVAAGGFELSTLVAYDYDDDGNDELVVPYEIKALPASRIAPALPAVWSFSATAIAPYARAPSLSGSVGVEHLDSDMRPDLATYGAFLGWFDADCGAKVCPPRISGPRFFFHSLADGGFSNDDEAARAALKRGCGGKAAPLVSANLEKTAKNLVCARASGSPVDAVRAELDSEAAGLCSGSSSCTVSKVLGSWLSAPLPVTIEGRVGPSTPARPPTP
jgi:hypothetical protein